MPEPKETPRRRAGSLGVLLIVLVAVAAYMWWPAAAPAPGSSNQARDARKTGAATAASGPLAVKLDALKQPPPPPAGETRNPFRFYIKLAPPPPPPQAVKPPVIGPPPVPVEQGPPPIPLKFIGTMEQGKKKVAIFSDGHGLPVYASEGELVLGQYRLVRIGVESVVMEYPDGRGRQTIPMRGQ
jgi:hypothetical protein